MKNWILEILGICLLGFLAIYGFSLLNPQSELLYPAYFALILFSVFTFIFFFLVSLMSKEKQRKWFFGVMVFSIALRMIATVGGILSYQSLHKPDSNWFVLPFLLFYLLYLAYENYKLIQLNQSFGRR